MSIKEARAKCLEILGEFDRSMKDRINEIEATLSNLCDTEAVELAGQMKFSILFGSHDGHKCQTQADVDALNMFLLYGE